MLLLDFNVKYYKYLTIILSLPGKDIRAWRKQGFWHALLPISYMHPTFVTARVFRKNHRTA